MSICSNILKRNFKGFQIHTLWRPLKPNGYFSRECCAIEIFQMRYCIKGHQRHQKSNFGFSNLLSKKVLLWDFCRWLISYSPSDKNLFWKLLIVVETFWLGKVLVRNLKYLVWIEYWTIVRIVQINLYWWRTPCIFLKFSTFFHCLTMGDW